MSQLLLRLACWCAVLADSTAALKPSAPPASAPRIVFEPPVFVGNAGFEDNRAHAGNFKVARGVLFGDSGGNMARLGPAHDKIFTSHTSGRSWASDNADLFPLDGRQVFDWGGKLQCIAAGMCSSQPLTDLLTPAGIHNVTLIEVAPDDGRLQKRQVNQLAKPIRLLGFPADWKFDPAHFGGSMVVHTFASGTVLMTFDVGFAGSGSWVGGPRASLLAARSTDGGHEFRFSAVVANASLFAGKHGDNSAWNGTLTGATEHDVVELPSGDGLLAVWRMGAGDGCGKEQFNISLCLAVGGYMPYFKAYSTDEGMSWSTPAPISNVDPPGCARPWMITLGDTVLLSGGRQRFSNTTDVSLWASNDSGYNWIRYSLSGWHNLLVQHDSYGGLPARFSKHVNSTLSPRETSSYTSLLRLSNEEAIVLYDHIFYEYPDKPPASPSTGKNFNNASIFSMRLRLQQQTESPVPSSKRNDPQGLGLTISKLGSRPECTSALGCSLNGNCVGGRCQCFGGWGGAHCGRLQLLPTTLASGYNLVAEEGTASWGGSMVRGDDGQWHSFVGEMADHCGLSAFLTNDRIIHAVSKTPIGPWVRQGSLHPFGVSAECPHAIRGPDGAYLVFHTGCGNLSNPNSIRKPERHDCTNATTPAHLMGPIHGQPSPSWQQRRRVPKCGHTAERTSVFVSASPAGPWEQHLLELRGHDINGVTWPPTNSTSRLGRRNGNPTAYIFENGTTVLLFRSEYATDADCVAVGGILTTTYRPGCTLVGLARAHTSWRGPYDVLGGPIMPFQQEDPHLYRDAAGHFHVLMHGMDPYGSKLGVGRHAFSIDGLHPWHYFNNTAIGAGDIETAFGNVVDLVGGGSIALLRRERPELVLGGADGRTPVALITGVQPGPPWRGDQTFTLVQPVATHASDEV